MSEFLARRWRRPIDEPTLVTTSEPGVLRGSEVVAEISAFGKSGADVEAIGRLIAAAPELLDVCLRVLGECEDTSCDPSSMSEEWQQLHRDVKAAAAKATGKETT